MKKGWCGMRSTGPSASSRELIPVIDQGRHQVSPRSCVRDRIPCPDRRDRAPASRRFRRREDAPAELRRVSSRAHARPAEASKRTANPRPWDARPSRSRAEIPAALTAACAHRRPASASASKTSTSTPACASTMAAESPLGPEPMTYARFMHSFFQISQSWTGSSSGH